MRTLVVALVIASGCGSRPPPDRPAPAEPTCDQAADHAAALLGPEDPSAERVRDVMHARCTHDQWSAEARSCIVGTRSLAEPRQCKQRLSPEQRAAFERDLAAMPGLAPGDEGWLPPACREWGELVMRSAECQNLSGQAAQRIHQAFSDAVLTWEAAKSSASTWRAIEASCQESAEMLRQLLAPICRW